jgi:lipoprotein-anchoring transpeptidase ErfK/SrfK
LQRLRPASGSRRHRRRPIVGGLAAAVLAALIGVVAAACSGEATSSEQGVLHEEPARAESAPAAPPSAAEIEEPESELIGSEPDEPERSCAPGTTRRLGRDGVAYAAALTRPAAAFKRPGGAKIESFGMTNANGFPTVFGVLSVVLDARCQPSWYRVQLPLRPNGTTGFVRARVVDLYRVTTRIEIDLSERRLEVFDRGNRILLATTAIGASGTPTPTGRYYVNQRLRPLDPAGPWGPAALGISAFSPTLVTWTQGGPIAIHGTNQPSSVGGETSNGCLRVKNDVMKRLFRQILAGTPVRIRA